MNPPGWRPNAPAVTFDELSAAFTRHPVVVIHFWAIWNGYDRPMDSRLQSLRAEFGAQVAFYSYDTDAPSEAGWEFLRDIRLMNLPALSCFIHGGHHETLIGLRDPAMLREKLAEWGQACPNPG